MIQLLSPGSGTGGGMSIGGAVTSGTAHSVLYIGAGGVLAQDNAKFYYDYTNHRLGLWNTAPQYTLDISGVVRATNVKTGLLIGDTGGVTIANSGGDSVAYFTSSQNIILLKGGGGTIGPYMYVQGLSTGPVDNEFGFFCAGEGSTANTDGPYFGMRGNLFTRSSNQRGYMFFCSGVPTSTMYGNDGVMSFQAASDLVMSAGGQQLISLGSGLISGSPYNGYSVSIGYGSTTPGAASIAIGYYSTASGTQALAVGNQNIISGSESLAVGEYINCLNDYTIGIGRSLYVMGLGDFAIGSGLQVQSTVFPSTFMSIGDVSVANPYFTQDNAFYLFGQICDDGRGTLYQPFAGVGMGLGQNVSDIRPLSTWQVDGSFASDIKTLDGTITSFPYTLTDWDCNIIVRNLSGDVTILLPDAGTCQGREYTVKNMDMSYNVWVDCLLSGAQYIDDGILGMPIVVKNLMARTFISNGANWFIKSINM